MKTKIFPLFILILLGITFITTQGCKRKGCTDPTALNYDPDAKKDDGSCEYLTEVHDTLFGKSITGLCTYPDFTGTIVNAPGAVISLYAGTSKTGTPVATAFADIAGNYTFPYLLPNNYFIFATYNTENQNTGKTIQGINFETNPGYAVVMASSNLTQNLSLTTIASTGNLKIALDTINAYTENSGANLTCRSVTLESHSRVYWETPYGNSEWGTQGALFSGSFYKWAPTKFSFDETDPSKTVIRAYVLLSTLNSNEPGRDGLGKCGAKALFVDTMNVGGVDVVRPVTDTCWFYSVSTVRYGKGYLCSGRMNGFYKHLGGLSDPEWPSTNNIPDTAMGYTGPWNVTQDLPVNLYFEYQGKEKNWNSTNTTFNYLFIFEGEMTFDKSDFYIKHASINHEILVKAHINMKGANNTEY